MSYDVVVAIEINHLPKRIVENINPCKLLGTVVGTAPWAPWLWGISEKKGCFPLFLSCGKKDGESCFCALIAWPSPFPLASAKGCGAVRQSLWLTERALVISNCKIHLGMVRSITLWIFCIQILNRLCTFLELSTHCFGRCFSVCPDLGLLSNRGGIYHQFLFIRNNKSGNYFERLTVEQGSAETEQGIVKGNSWTEEKGLRREWMANEWFLKFKLCWAVPFGT